MIAEWFRLRVVSGSPALGEKEDRHYLLEGKFSIAKVGDLSSKRCGIYRGQCSDREGRRWFNRSPDHLP